jgi:hypothetical protein
LGISDIRLEKDFGKDINREHGKIEKTLECNSSYIMDYSEDFIKRFWDKVIKTDTCWIWTGAKTGGRYGAYGHNPTYLAHRLSLELHLRRSIGEGLVVAHQPILCHNSLCVNPEHLRETTQQENILDKHIDGTMPMGENHGRWSRSLTDEQVIAIRNDKKMYKDIATEYNVARSTISNIKSNKTFNHLIVPIEPHRPASRFTVEQIRSIRNDTRICNEIATDYGVTRQSIQSIKARDSYKWVID